jgi:hypothetical protein
LASWCEFGGHSGVENKLRSTDANRSKTGTWAVSVDAPRRLSTSHSESQDHHRRTPQIPSHESTGSLDQPPAKGLHWDPGWRGGGGRVWSRGQGHPCRPGRAGLIQCVLLRDRGPQGTGAARVPVGCARSEVKAPHSEVPRFWVGLKGPALQHLDPCLLRSRQRGLPLKPLVGPSAGVGTRHPEQSRLGTTSTRRLVCSSHSVRRVASRPAAPK